MFSLTGAGKVMQDYSRNPDEGVQMLQVRAGSRGCDHALTLPFGGSVRDIDVGPELVLIPPGAFWMGSHPGHGRGDEHPRHQVLISYPLLAAKFPVTYDEWAAAVAAGAKLEWLPDEGWGRGRRPLMRSGWYDARDYAHWLSVVTGKAYRLPSEAEWEYCCRAGTVTAYSFGDTITAQQACFDKAEETTPIGSYPANAFGLHDMHGNVCEWCTDDWHNNYDGAPTDGSAWVDSISRTMKVCRGGTWFNVRDYLRSAARDKSPAHPIWRGRGNGFRVVREVEPQARDRVPEKPG
jgi:formylglycine-generating enzyme required for sulfatase activity